VLRPVTTSHKHHKHSTSSRNSCCLLVTYSRAAVIPFAKYYIPGTYRALLRYSCLADDTDDRPEFSRPPAPAAAPPTAALGWIFGRAVFFVARDDDLRVNEHYHHQQLQQQQQHYRTF